MGDAQVWDINTTWQQEALVSFRHCVALESACAKKSRRRHWARKLRTPICKLMLPQQQMQIQINERVRFRLQVGATCKHFAAYSLENADGYSRHSFNATVSQR